MYAYITGKLSYKSPTEIYLEANGIAYHLLISLNTYSDIEKLDDAKVFTYLHVKEDALTLFGFSTQEEKEIFQLLISVSGIGPNTARIVLSSLKSVDVQKAILHEDALTFNRVKGIGPKTAKRIILDLKDKVSKQFDGEQISAAPDHNTKRYEALSALIALGFPKNTVEKVLIKAEKNLDENASVEQIIKEVLKQMR